MTTVPGAPAAVPYGMRSAPAIGRPVSASSTRPLTSAGSEGSVGCGCAPARSCVTRRTAGTPRSYCRPAANARLSAWGGRAQPGAAAPRPPLPDARVDRCPSAAENHNVAEGKIEDASTIGQPEVCCLPGATLESTVTIAALTAGRNPMRSVRTAVRRAARPELVTWSSARNRRRNSFFSRIQCTQCAETSSIDG